MKKFLATLLGTLIICAPSFAQSPPPIFPYTQDPITGTVTFRVPVTFPPNSPVNAGTITATPGPIIFSPMSMSTNNNCLLASNTDTHSCGILVQSFDTADPSAQHGAIFNMTSSNGANVPGGPGVIWRTNTAFESRFHPGTASGWTLVGGMNIDLGVDLSAHTFNMGEFDIYNYADWGCPQQGTPGGCFSGPNVTGFTMTGGIGAPTIQFPNSYAYNVEGTNFNATTVSSAVSSTNFNVNGTIFHTGSLIRIITGSATKGLNGTIGYGKVTNVSGGGPQTLTVVWKSADPGTPGANDWVEVINDATSIAALWQRGYVVDASVVQCGFCMYARAEKGISFEGSQTDVGIDFATMATLNPGTAIDFRMGASDIISGYHAGNADFGVMVFQAAFGDLTIGTTAAGLTNLTSLTINPPTVTLGNITTGTPAASLCIDASNHIVKKTTTGACI